MQLKRRLERERKSRLNAEAIAERGLRDLYVSEQQFRLLADIAAAANQARSIEDTLRYVLERICETTGWLIGHAYVTQTCAGAVLIRSTGVWHGLASTDFAEFRHATEKVEFAPGVGLPGRVYLERAPLWSIDVTQDAGFPRQVAAQACGQRGAYAFPVMLADEVVAVLEFFTDKTVDRDDRLLELMSQIGVQLGRVMERKRGEERLIHDASHDSLTGLPNRALFMDRLNQAMIQQYSSRDDLFAVLFIDLDRFKVVNDSLGHHVGDKLIVEVADRLESALRQESAGMAVPHDAGTLARLGGDEFTILLTNMHDPSDAMKVANRVQERLKAPFLIEGQEIYTGASIGIASSSTGYSSADQILRDADLAMYRAKALGKSRTELYDRDMHAAAMKRLMLEADLRRALANKEFVLHYQPIVSLETRDVTGFEALVRWQRPGGELVYPGEFIELAEDTGLILYLGMWVLREACTTMRRMQQDFPRPSPLTISVNLSPRQFVQPDLVTQVRQIIDEAEIDPSTVRLEITESATAGDAKLVQRVLSELKAIGIRLSIDDFGTGYSSLSYLHQFPLDILKIDRSFISELGHNEQSLQIVRTILTLARSLGMSVVAEGTEVESQVAQLRLLGCDFGQGYFFSRPVDASGVRALLEVDGTGGTAEIPDDRGANWHQRQLQKIANLGDPAG